MFTHINLWKDVYLAYSKRDLGQFNSVTLSPKHQGHEQGSFTHETAYRGPHLPPVSNHTIKD